MEAKKNLMADYLSRSDTIGKNYIAEAADPDLEAGVYSLEMVSLQTLSPKALADYIYSHL